MEINGIEVKSGVEWFRPMDVSVNFRIRNLMEAEELVQFLEQTDLGCDDIQILRDAMEREQKDTVTSPNGYIYDPQRNYADLEHDDRV